MVKMKKVKYAEIIVDIIKQFFKDKYNVSVYNLMKLDKETLINLYYILNELKQKRLEDYING